MFRRKWYVYIIFLFRGLGNFLEEGIERLLKIEVLDKFSKIMLFGYSKIVVYINL